MRLSALFSSTLREMPAGVTHEGLRLLVRAGYVRLLEGGQRAYLPLGQRALSKLARLLESAVCSIGAQPIALPEVHAFASLARSVVRSYRQLPQIAYALELGGAAPRFHLWTLTRTAEEDARLHDSVLQALRSAFEQAGLVVQQTEHGLARFNDAGEALLAKCDTCGYLDFADWAQFARTAVSSAEAMLPLERVYTPACKTIESLAQFLGIPTAATAKALFFVAAFERNERLVFAVVRGDLRVSEAKLRSALGAHALRPASELEIRSIGAEPGFASPVGLVRDGRWLLVVDPSIVETPNLVAGANAPDYHLRNTNYGRDYTADLVAEIAMAPEGSQCARCGAPLRWVRGDALVHEQQHVYEGTYLDPAGNERTPPLRLYSAALDDLLCALALTYRDEFGLTLPTSVAPYHVHLVVLGKDEATYRQAETLYTQLLHQNIEALFDDRSESPGVKFNDADLIGAPVRLTVSARSLQAGGVEVRFRAKKETMLVPLEAVVERVSAALA